MISRLAEWFSQNSARIAHACAALLTPFFYVAAFPPYNVGEAAFVFLVPFAIWLRFLPSYRSVAWTSLAIGWVSWIILIFWLRHVTWMGAFLLSGVMGAHFMVWALGAAWLTRRSAGRGLWAGLPLTLGAGALWVGIEHLRGHLFSGFPWLPLSASQWGQPIMLQGAAFFGSWSISFSLVILNFGIAAYLAGLVVYARTRKREICPEFYFALSFVVATSFMLLGNSSGQQREPAFRAGVVQPVISQNEKWDAEFVQKILGQLELQTLSLKPLSPDAAFWPETALPYPLNDDGYAETWASRLATELGAPVFAGAMGIEQGEEDREWYNSVFLVQPELGLFGRYYAKRHLVPFGEYIPLRWLWPWMEKVVPIGGDILPGRETALLPLHAQDTTIRIGSLICYEDVFPSLARASVKEGAGALFVATNSAWYGRSGAGAQHMAHSVLRAVETRRPVLRVGNDGWTGWIDEYGSVRNSLEPWEQQWTVWQVTRDRRWVGKQTVYVRYGDWFVWVCWGVFAFCLWVAPKSGEAR